jgi:DNA-nicking Smr family endonuclease
MVKDAGLFSAAMADVKPLDGRRRLARPAAARAAPPAAKPPPVKRLPIAPVEPELRADDKSFDRDVARALSRGKLAPEATLDLHGMTLAAAERAVGSFLERATERDFRIVLIVTGKGLREEGGRLIGGRIRAEFIGWLNRADNRALARGVRPAHPHHGGSGAFYVLLRRRSSARSRSLRDTPQR